MKQKSASDPIFGSGGDDTILPSRQPTPEERLENDLNSRKPLEVVDDSEDVIGTQASIATAEKAQGAKLELPMKDAQEKYISNNAAAIAEEADNWDDSDDVKETLKSAHQAEWLFGYHGYGSGNYSGGHNHTGYNNYTKGEGYGNGTYSNDPWAGWGYGNYLNGWAGGQWTHGTPYPRNSHLGGGWNQTWDWGTWAGPGYIGHYNSGGHGHKGFRCKKPKNPDWWRSLGKDNGEDGMVTTKNDAFDWWVPKDYDFNSGRHIMDTYCDEWEAMWNGEGDKPDSLKKPKDGDGNSTEGGNSTEKSEGDGKDGPKSPKSAVPKGKGDDKGDGELPTELAKGAPAEGGGDKAKSEEVVPELAGQLTGEGSGPSELQAAAPAPAAEGGLPSELTKGAPAAAVQHTEPNSSDFDTEGDSPFEIDVAKTLAPSVD
jgi:hypothetical protein